MITRFGDAAPREDFVQQVYRFWNEDIAGKPSHFFSVDQRECAVLRDRPEWKWHFEGMAFWAHVSTGDRCETGRPLFRVYNNGIGGAPTHRFAVRQEIVDAMVAQGWVSEGVAMCVSNGPVFP